MKELLCRWSNFILANVPCMVIIVSVQQLNWQLQLTIVGSANELIVLAFGWRYRQWMTPEVASEQNSLPLAPSSPFYFFFFKGQSFKWQVRAFSVVIVRRISRKLSLHSCIMLCSAKSCWPSKYKEVSDAVPVPFMPISCVMYRLSPTLCGCHVVCQNMVLYSISKEKKKISTMPFFVCSFWVGSVKG